MRLGIVFSEYRIRNFPTPIIESVRIPARITPCPTGRLFGVALSQHFVPGYDRTVPPGHEDWHAAKEIEPFRSTLVSRRAKRDALRTSLVRRVVSGGG
jgi:hypothetical protein